MTSFSSVVKPFSRVLATKDTTVVTKPLSITAVRAIRPIQSTLTIPEHLVTVAPTTIAEAAATGRRLLFQFNCSAVHEFTLTNVPNRDNYGRLSSGYLVIRWRVGSTVYRYLLQKTVTLPGKRVINYWGGEIDGFQSYTGQVIKSNFCLEYYSMFVRNGTIESRGINSAMSFQTSIINAPTMADPEVFSAATPIVYDQADLAATPLYEFPQSQTNIAWLDNV